MHGRARVAEVCSEARHCNAGLREVGCRRRSRQKNWSGSTGRHSLISWSPPDWSVVAHERPGWSVAAQPPRMCPLLDRLGCPLSAKKRKRWACTGATHQRLRVYVRPLHGGARRGSGRRRWRRSARARGRLGRVLRQKNARLGPPRLHPLAHPVQPTQHAVVRSRRVELRKATVTDTHPC